MTKIVIKRNQGSGFTNIPNYFIQDTSLSIGARGIMAYILSQRDDWIIYKSHLMKVFKKGKYAIRTVINELEKAGYLSCKDNRIKKTIKNGSKFASISNNLIKNNSLSAQARGLMAYFLSFPDDWMIYKAQLIKNSKEGRYAITSAMDELKKAGYLFCKKNGNRGCWQYYVFTEIPTEEELEFLFPKNKIFKISENQPLSISNCQVPNYQIFKISKNQPLIKTNLKYIKHTYKKESKPKKVEPKKTEATASLASKEAHSFSFSKGIQECADLFENNLKSVRSNYKITEAIRLEWMRNMNEIVATGEGTVEEIHDVLVWVSGNVFWHNRIHTGKTLRSKFSELCSYMNPRLKSNNTNSLGYDKNSDKDYDEKKKLLSGLCEYLVTRYQRDMFKINRLKHTDSYFKDESKDVFISVKDSLNEMKEKIFCNYPEFKLCYKY
jgi:hypothetical protein